MKEYSESPVFDDNEMNRIQSGEDDVLCGGDGSPRKIWRNVYATIFITLDVEQSSSVAKYLSVITNLVRMTEILATDTHYYPHPQHSISLI